MKRCPYYLCAFFPQIKLLTSDMTLLSQPSIYCSCLPHLIFYLLSLYCIHARWTPVPLSAGSWFHYDWQSNTTLVRVTDVVLHPPFVNNHSHSAQTEMIIISKANLLQFTLINWSVCFCQRQSVSHCLTNCLCVLHKTESLRTVQWIYCVDCLPVSSLTSRLCKILLKGYPQHRICKHWIHLI